MKSPVSNLLWVSWVGAQSLLVGFTICVSLHACVTMFLISPAPDIIDLSGAGHI